MTYEEVLAYEPFSVIQAEKERFYAKCLNEMTRFHREHCVSYRHMLDAIGFDEKNYLA